MTIDTKLKYFTKVNLTLGAIVLAGLLEASSLVGNISSNYVMFKGSEYEVKRNNGVLTVVTPSAKIHDLNHDGIADYKTIDLCHPRVGCFKNIPVELNKKDVAIYKAITASFR